MRTLSCLLIALLTVLVACTPDEVVPEDSVVSAPISVTRVTSTPELVVVTETAVSATTTSTPSATPTAPATAHTNQDFPSIRPTATRRPTETPIPTATSLPTHYDLPTWLNDPETAVLMAEMGLLDSEEDGIAFMNVGSGELFILPSPQQMTYLAWGQDEAGIYFEFDHNHLVGNMVEDLFMERVYIETGLSIEIPAETWSIPGTASPDSRYVARTIREDEIQNVILEDLETMETITLTDPFNGRYPDYIQMDWSLTGNLLSVLRYKFGTPLGSGLTIYTQNGEIYRQFENRDGFTWSPYNNQQILYETGSEFGSKLPCILDIKEINDICLEEILTWRENLGVKTDYYQWSYDGNQIGFVYWGFDTLGRISGFCFIEISTDEIYCPVDWETLGGREEVGQINYIVGAPIWSPDGRYMSFVIDYISPESDTSILYRIVTTDLDGHHMQIWGRGHQHFLAWRPPINP